jgi:hypothetical protein
MLSKLVPRFPITFDRPLAGIVISTRGRRLVIDQGKNNYNCNYQIG